MTQALIRTAEPLTLPVSLNEVKAHLRIDASDEDALLVSMIRAATNATEDYLGRALITQSWSLFIDHWPSGRRVDLPKPPAQSVDSVLVFADDDTSTVYSAANYYLNLASDPGRVFLRRGVVPPTPARISNGIEIRFIAGYGASQSDVPVPIVEGMKRLIAHWFEHREIIAPRQSAASVPISADVLFAPYRLVRL